MLNTLVVTGSESATTHSRCTHSAKRASAASGHGESPARPWFGGASSLEGDRDRMRAPGPVD